MSRAFTRADLAGMRQEDVAAQLDDVNAWVAAGAVDGQGPPAAPTSFTSEQLRTMTAEEMAANIDAVNASLGGAA